jgi:hypothetical protein
MASILISETLTESRVSLERLRAFEPSFDFNASGHQTLLSSEVLSEAELWALWYTEKANERVMHEVSSARALALEDLLQ